MCKSNKQKLDYGSCKSTIKIKSVLIVDEETGKIVERYNLENYETFNKNFYKLKNT